MRRALKHALGRCGSETPAQGATVLIYHRVGGKSPDERDLSVDSFTEQVDALADSDVVSLDEALSRLDRGDDRPSVVLTFDDGFADVYDSAWPLLRDRRLPFTLYLATAYVGGVMHWDGSGAKAAGSALTWPQITEMASSGLCTVGNHTHTHARPELLTPDELDQCSEQIEHHVGIAPRHFAYTWGVPVPRAEPDLRTRFVSAATGRLGRNLPGVDPLRLRRVPVRQSDPIEFFRAKLTGRLLPERTYGALVAAAKRGGMRA